MSKLIRDQVPQNIARVHIADADEYRCALMSKLSEETVEVIAVLVGDRDPSELESELADVIEVCYAIGRELGTTPGAIEVARIRRLRDRGGFTKRIILDQP